jgi:hypothetical protein
LYLGIARPPHYLSSETAGSHWTIHDRIATQSPKNTAAGLRDNLRAAAAQTG